MSVVRQAGAAERAQPRNSTARRLSAVLTMVVSAESIGVTDLSRGLGLAKTTAHRLLSDLEDVGLVARLGDSKYTVGPALLGLTARTREKATLERIARPELEALNQATDESVQLVVRDGLEAVYRDVIPAQRPIRLYIQHGGRAPLWAGASTRLLLAYLSDAEREAVLKASPPRPLTANTIIEPVELAAVLERTRASGVATSFGELAPGSAELAVPVWNSDGQVAAAVSLAGLEADYRDAARVESWLAALRAHASRVTLALGGEPGGA